MKARLYLCFVALLAALPACADDAAQAAGGNGGAEEGDGGAADGGGAAEGGSDAGGDNAGGSPVVVDPCAGFITEVVDVTYGPDAGVGQADMPGIVLGPPEGAGTFQGSFDVVALGNGGSIVLGFGEQTIVDEEGPDFIVFENAFYAGGDEDAPFAELGTVSVSEDGETWHTFPCTAVEAPYGACAGWHPVIAGSEGSSADPHDPAEAGGDAFDLADLGVSAARFVRIEDRADTTGLSGSFDLDAIALVHWTCDAR